MPSNAVPSNAALAANASASVGDVTVSLTAPTATSAVSSGAGSGAGAGSAPTAAAIASVVGDVALRFHVQYETAFGEELLVAGSSTPLGNWVEGRYLPMKWTAGHVWEAVVGMNRSEGSIEYKYVLRRADGSLHWEYGDNRSLDLTNCAQQLDLAEQWRSDKNDTFYRSAFKDVVLARDATGKPTPWTIAGCTQVRFQLYEPNVPRGHSVYVSGSSEALGAWAASKALKMSDAQYPLWTAVLELKASEPLPLVYKYFTASPGVADAAWETGENRHASASPLLLKTAGKGQGASTTLTVTASGLQTAPSWRGAGVAIPVFSLRSKKSMGVGEFLDLKLLVDWAVQVGMSLVQILPINDTSVYGDWRDSYPYNSVSVLALHPIYINIEAMGPFSAKITSKHASLFASLTADSTAQLDYDGVMAAKLSLLKDIYQEKGDAQLSSAAYKTWFGANKAWLQPYALYCMFRDLQGVADPSKWGSRSSITARDIDELTKPTTMHYRSAAFWYFVQYNLHLQLVEASEYAVKHHVALKGDLPIGVARFGVDAWVEPHLFNMNTQTGAPPDYFATLGQNWGFPTYNWDQMAKTGYAWWSRRLTQMSQYFQAFRIDHILGFFRIWEIPEHGVTGLLGKFSPSNPISQGELEAAGIWDFDRLCDPYIRSWTLDHMFGHESGYVRLRFFNSHHHTVYHFKEEYNTEAKLKAALSDPADKELLAKLISLITNVVLMRVGHGQYVPRIEMKGTSAFWELDEAQKGALQRLYVSYFFERQEQLWTEKAMQKLPAIKAASDMLVCGEDLGMVPDCVPGVMDDTGVLSLRIQRMPADSKKLFAHPDDYPYMSVCSTSSHDTSTLRGWWEEDLELTQKFWNSVLHRPGTAPATCTPEAAWMVLEQHLWSKSMWAIFPIQDLMATSAGLRATDPHSERINVPAIAQHYWRWRLHMNLEDLVAAKDWNAQLRDKVVRSGRRC